MTAATVLDIKKKEFNKAVRGYAMHEVDAFLDQIVEELEGLRKEISRLQQKTSDRAADETIARTMLTAQRTADRTVESAEAMAQAVLSEADMQATSVTDSAQLRAREMIQAAEDHAREVTEEAEETARGVKGELARRRQDLDRSIDLLRTFERDYRGRLRQCVEAQLKALEDAAPAGPVAPPMPTGLASADMD
jgi:DivIVA domain-containing protein